MDISDSTGQDGHSYSFRYSLLVILYLLLFTFSTFAQQDIQSCLGDACKFDLIAGSQVQTTDTVRVAGNAASRTTNQLIQVNGLFFEKECILDKVQRDIDTARKEFEQRQSTQLTTTQLSDTSVTEGTFEAPGNLHITGELILVGGDTSEFVFNVPDSLIIEDSAKITLAGVKAQNIVFNVREHIVIESNVVLNGRFIAEGDIVCGHHVEGDQVTLFCDSLLRFIDAPEGAIGMEEDIQITEVDLGRASSFAAIAGQLLSVQHPTLFNGHVGAMSSLQSGNISTTGTVFPAGDCAVQKALLDLSSVYKSLFQIPADTTLDRDLSGRLLPPGFYELNEGALIKGKVELYGNPQDKYIFRITDSLLATGEAVIENNGILPWNIFWVIKPGAARRGNVRIDKGAEMYGNVMSSDNIRFNADHQGMLSMFTLRGDIDITDRQQDNSAHIISRSSVEENCDTFLVPTGDTICFFFPPVCTPSPCCFPDFQTKIDCDTLFPNDFKLSVQGPGSYRFCKSSTIKINIDNTSQLDMDSLFVGSELDSILRYIPGSVNGAQEYNANPNQPIFLITSLQDSVDTSFTIRVKPQCHPTLSKNITNIFNVFNTDSFIFDRDTTTTNYLYPHAFIDDVTPKTVEPDSGAAFCREITIKSNGNMALLTDLFYQDVMDSSVIAVDSILVNNTSVPFSYASDTLSVHIDSIMLDTLTGGIKLPVDSTMTITECIRLKGCIDQDLTTKISVTPSCNGEICFGEQTSDFAYPQLNRPDPAQLDVNLLQTQLDTCYGSGNQAVFTWTMQNNGNTTASDISIEIKDDLNTATNIDSGTFILNIHGNDTLVQPTTLQKDTTSSLSDCTGDSLISRLVFDLPDLLPDSSMRLRFTATTCCPPAGCTNPNRWNFFYKVRYWRACYGKDSVCPGLNCRQGSRKGNVSWFNEGPTDLFIGRDTTIFIENTTCTRSLGDSSYCLPYSVSSVPGNINIPYWPGDTATDQLKAHIEVTNPGLEFTDVYPVDSSAFLVQSGDTLWPDSVVLNSNFNWDVYFPFDTALTLNDQFMVYIDDTCPANPANFIKTRWSYIPAPSCSPDCDVPIGAIETRVQVHCPGCEKQGPLNAGLEVTRKNYGSPDNDCDGMADVSGTIDTNTVKNTFFMVGDTIRLEHTANFQIQSYLHPWPLTDSFTHAYYEIRVVCLDQLQPVKAEVTIIDASTSSTYRLDVPTNLLSQSYLSVQPNKLLYDLSIDSLHKYNPSLPASFTKFENGDKFFIHPQYVVNTNVGVSCEGGVVCEVFRARLFAGFAPKPGCDNAFCCPDTTAGPDSIPGYVQLCDTIGTCDSFTTVTTRTIGLCGDTITEIDSICVSGNLNPLSQKSRCDSTVIYYCEFWGTTFNITGYDLQLNSFDRRSTDSICCNYRFNISQRLNIGEPPGCRKHTFANEFRQWTVMDSMYVVLPPGFTYCSGHVTQTSFGCDTALRSKSVPISPDTVFNTVRGDSLLFVVSRLYSQDATRHFEDSLHRNTDDYLLNLSVGAHTTCRLDTVFRGEWHAGGILDYGAWAQWDTTTRKQFRSRDSITVAPPRFNVTSPEKVVDASTRPACWDLEIENTGDVASNIWLHGLSPDSTIHPFLVVDQNHSPPDTLTQLNDLFVMNHPLGFQGQEDLELCANLTCPPPSKQGQLDTLFLITGWDCPQPPDSFAANTCKVDTSILVVNYLTPKITVEYALPDSITLCDTVPLRITVQNVGEANAYNNRWRMELPEGMDLLANSVQVAYPGDTSNLVFNPVSNPTQSGDTLRYLIDSLTSYTTQNGLPGGANVSSADSSTLVIDLLLISDCDNKPSASTTFRYTAENFCGDTIPVGNTPFVYQPTITDFPTLGTFNVAMDFENFGKSNPGSGNLCDTITRLNVFITNDDSVPLGPNNRFHLKLPPGTHYVAGSFQGQCPFRPDSVPLVANNELTWILPDTIPPDSCADFDIHVAVNDSPCTGNFTVEGFTSSGDTVFCEHIDTFCVATDRNSPVITSTAYKGRFKDQWTLFAFEDTVCQYQSVKFKPADDFTKATCGVHEWHFGDPFAGSDNVAFGDSVSHAYEFPGTYTVTHIRNYGCMTDTARDTITILDAAGCCAIKQGLTYDIQDTTYTISNTPASNLATISDQSFSVGGTITVDSGVTLNILGSTLEFGPFGKIVVKPGAELNISYSATRNTVLRSASTPSCKFMWQGIEVWGKDSLKGKVEAGLSSFTGTGIVPRNAIKDAHIAILAGRRNQPIPILVPTTLTTSTVKKVIPANQLTNPYKPGFGGGYIVSGEEITYRQNGKDIVFTPFDQADNISSISRSDFFGGIVKDSFYHSSTPFSYPNTAHPWNGPANQLQRTAINIRLIKKAKSVTITGNDFGSSEIGIQSISSEHDVFGNNFGGLLGNMRKGIDIHNVNNNYMPHTIQNNSFRLINDTVAPRHPSSAIMLHNGRWDIIKQNRFGRLSNNLTGNGFQIDNHNAIYAENSADFEIVNDNIFRKYLTPIEIYNSGNGGGDIGWDQRDNLFEQTGLDITTVYDNSELIIKCNDHDNPNQLLYSGSNWTSGPGILRDQLQWPDDTISRQDSSKFGAGNEFFPPERKEISEVSSPYEYFHHTPTTSDSIVVPEPLGNIVRHDIGVPKLQDNVSCQTPVFCKCEGFPPPACCLKVIDEFNLRLQQLRSRRAELRQQLDGGGQTQTLLNTIENEQRAGQLKATLMNSSPLSDTVMTRFVERKLNDDGQGKPSIPHGMYKDVIIRNSPVGAPVRPKLYRSLSKVPNGIAKEIKQAQVNRIYDNQTLESVRKQILWTRSDKQEVMRGLLNTLLSEDTVPATQQAIDFLNDENTVYAGRLLTSVYLNEDSATQAQQTLQQVPDTNIALTRWKSIMQIQVDLAAQSKTLYEMDSSQLLTVQIIANTSEPTLARSQARGILKMFFYQEFPRLTLPQQSNKRGLFRPKLGKEDTARQNTVYVLGNNIPDPFNNTTHIPYQVPDSVEAGLRIYDVNGNLLNTYELNPQRARITVSLQSYKAGVYLYSLFVNGVPEATKRMTLIK